MPLALVALQADCHILLFRPSGYVGQTLDMLVHREDRSQLYELCRGPSRSLSSRHE